MPMPWGTFRRARAIVVYYESGPVDVFVRARGDDEDKRWGQGKDIQAPDDYFRGDDFRDRAGVGDAELLEGLRKAIET